MKFQLKIITFFLKTNKSTTVMLPDEFPVFQIDLDVAFDCSDDKFPKFISSEMRKNICVQEEKFGIFCTIGSRKSNLDEFSYLFGDGWKMYAVFDGHSDGQTACYLKTNLLNKLSQHSSFRSNTKNAILEVFSAVEEEVVKSNEKGSTALVAIVMQETLMVANLGDSKAFGICKDNSVKELNRVHNLTNSEELMQVISKGGIVLKKGTQYRINGELNLSRAFGDKAYKYCMSAIPDISLFQITQFSRIVLATDGFYSEENLSERLLLKNVNKIDEMNIGYHDNATALYLML